MTITTTLYACDEDAAIRAPGDFALLCPRDQVLAHGVDGVLAATDGWLLRSASVDFQARGVVAGHVVQLRGPAADDDDLLIVETVEPYALRLRRMGLAPGLGHPTRPAGASGEEFLVATLTPQIETACYDLNRRFGIDPQQDGRRPADLYDLRELREAAVLSVLHARYLDLSQGETCPLGLKARQFRVLRDDVLARLAPRWKTHDVDNAAVATAFSVRLAR